MDIYGDDGNGTVVIAAGFRGEYNKLPFVRALAIRLAASGLRAIAYPNSDPLRDLHELLREVGECAIWASSGNGPVALSAIMKDAPFRVRCAVLHYAYTFNAQDAANQYGFVDGCAGASIDDLRTDVPLFVSRAGRDSFAGLNDALGHFVAGAIARNMPVTFVNHPSGAHAFDLVEKDAMGQDIIEQSIEFVRFHLNQPRS